MIATPPQHPSEVSAPYKNLDFGEERQSVSSSKSFLHPIARRVADEGSSYASSICSAGSIRVPSSLQTE
jgi:hypothetical protein